MTKLSIFDAPDRTRVLWHDLKTFPSATHVYLDSILNGTYGEVPPAIASIMHSLKVAAIKNILTIENISILHKIENDSLEIKPTTAPLNEQASSALNFILPLATNDKKTISLTISPEALMHSDTRYGSTILQNMLVLALHFSSPGAALNLTSTQDGVMITGQTQATTQTISDQTSAKHIYSPEQTAETLPALFFYTTEQLANTLGFTFKITAENDTLSIYYAKK